MLHVVMVIGQDQMESNCIGVFTDQAMAEKVGGEVEIYVKTRWHEGWCPYSVEVHEVPELDCIGHVNWNWSPVRSEPMVTWDVKGDRKAG